MYVEDERLQKVIGPQIGWTTTFQQWKHELETGQSISNHFGMSSVLFSYSCRCLKQLRTHKNANKRVLVWVWYVFSECCVLLRKVIVFVCFWFGIVCLFVCFWLSLHFAKIARAEWSFAFLFIDLYCVYKAPLGAYAVFVFILFAYTLHTRHYLEPMQSLFLFY